MERGVLLSAARSAGVLWRSHAHQTSSVTHRPATSTGPGKTGWGGGGGGGAAGRENRGAAEAAELRCREAGRPLPGRQPSAQPGTC